MRKVYLFFSVLFIICHISNAQHPEYYLPRQVNYNPSVPRPKDVIFHEVGEWHVTHDRLVQYMKALAAAVPSRIKLENIGFTYEGRPQILLIITSPSNHSRLEEIRQEHLQLCDPERSSALNIENMPVVVWIGNSIHGNESSGSNAALLTAYHLAAAQGPDIEDLLQKTVIILDPCFNPDGLQRFSTWVNQHKSKTPVSDPNHREFQEVWPGGRFNHYWFDLNRDWLPAVHTETRNRLIWYHRWKPNVLTDHHEQSSNATFFFQPGVPSRVHPLTSEKNQELTARLARFHARYLDSIGTYYFTKENYDDFYYGKGSTYPDINGGVGILFEQASSRGHVQQTTNGLLSFPYTIRNQFVTSLSTLEGARALRKELLEWQRTFYKKSVQTQPSAPAGYVFGDPNDETKTRMFVNLLLRHQIEVKELPENRTDPDWPKGKAYFVSLQQPQRVLIQAIFENVPEYRDSLFYDITAWNLPLAYGLSYKPVVASRIPATARTVSEMAEKEGKFYGAQSEYGYLISWNDYYAPAALYYLLNQGLLVKVSTRPFETQTTEGILQFNPGTLLIPVTMQTTGSDEIYRLLNNAVKLFGVKIYSLSGGSAVSGTDLGSSRFVTVTRPTVALLAGAGINPTDAGEIWFLLDQHMQIPCTLLEPSVFNRTDISKYNTLILPGGNYNELNKDKLKTWIQNGGTLIALEEAVNWVAQNGISDIKFKKPKPAVDSTTVLSYAERENIEGAQQMNGAILEAETDLTHPLAFGYHKKTVSLFKANKIFPEKSKNPYANPFRYGVKPLQSGWVSKENLEAIRNTAAVIVSAVGSGRVIHISDNPNFRGFWLGGTKLFMNAVLLSRVIEAASARTEE
ncbi:MAG: M14 family metallopeptidase [Chitinophagaceae bacterium]|nr:M14 family metallopeptidase [Chitinophagaceae bacterium]